MNKFTTGLAIAAMGSVLAVSQALAETKTLVIASWAGPSHVVNKDMWPAFIKRIEEISDGALTAEIKLNLVPPPASADLVLDKAADITFIFHGYNAGRFVTTQLAELPGIEGTAEQSSAAYWRVYEKYLQDAGEQEEFKTLAMFSHGAAQLHLARPIEGLSDLAGMKIRAPGGVGSIMVEGLGAVGIQVPATKVYETLSAGAADGVTINVDGRIGYTLDEVAPVLYEVPGGLYRGSFAALMNKDTWNELSPELQEKLDAEFFGEPMSRLFGKLWDDGDEVARANTVTLGNPIVAASEADMALLEPLFEKAKATVLEQISAKGIDAQAAYDFYVAQVAELRGETSK
ncbi:MAG: TRAP transporter substrate-binding protein [Sulfitobacter sp.]